MPRRAEGTMSRAADSDPRTPAAAWPSAPAPHPLRGCLYARRGGAEHCAGRMGSGARPHLLPVCHAETGETPKKEASRQIVSLICEFNQYVRREARRRDGRDAFRTFVCDLRDVRTRPCVRSPAHVGARGQVAQIAYEHQYAVSPVSASRLINNLLIYIDIERDDLPRRCRDGRLARLGWGLTLWNHLFRGEIGHAA